MAQLLRLKQSKSSDFLRRAEKLRKMGNFLHNVKVIQGEELGSVVSRRAPECHDLLPCLYCYGFISTHCFYKHRCDWRDNDDDNKFNIGHSLNRALLDSACLLGNQEKWVRDIREFVQQHMAMDDISKVVEEDRHILFCGALLVKMLGKGRVDEISQKLTFLGKLSLTLQTTNPAKENLESFITGQSFDAVIKAAGEISGAVKGNERCQTLEHPSLPFEVGYMLALIATVKKGRALVCLDRHDLFTSETFLSCLQREQPISVSPESKNALAVSPQKRKTFSGAIRESSSAHAVGSCTQLDSVSSVENTEPRISARFKNKIASSLSSIVEKSSSSKDTIMGKSSSSIDTIMGKSSSSMDTIMGRSSSSKDTLVEKSSSSMDTMMEKSSSSIDTIMGRSSSSKDTIMGKSSSSKDTLVEKSSSSMDTMMEKSSSSIDTIMGKSSSSKDTLVEKSSSSQDTMVEKAPRETTSLTDGLVPRAGTACINKNSAQTPSSNNANEIAIHVSFSMLFKIGSR